MKDRWIGGLLLVMEVTIVNDSRVECLSISHDNIVSRLRDHASSTPILRVNYKDIIGIGEQYTKEASNIPYSYKSLMTCEKFFLVSLCKLEIAIRAARMA